MHQQRSRQERRRWEKVQGCCKHLAHRCKGISRTYHFVAFKRKTKRSPSPSSSSSCTLAFFPPKPRKKGIAIHAEMWTNIPIALERETKSEKYMARKGERDYWEYVKKELILYPSFVSRLVSLSILISVRVGVLSSGVEPLFFLVTSSIPDLFLLDTAAACRGMTISQVRTKKRSEMERGSIELFLDQKRKRKRKV